MPIGFLPLALLPFTKSMKCSKSSSTISGVSCGVVARYVRSEGKKTETSTSASSSKLMETFSFVQVMIHQVTTKLLFFSQWKSSDGTSFDHNMDQEFSKPLHGKQLEHDHFQKDTNQTCVQQIPKTSTWFHQ